MEVWWLLMQMLIEFWVFTWMKTYHLHFLTQNILSSQTMVFPVVMYGCYSWTIKKTKSKELMLLNCGVGEDSRESLGLQEDETSPSWRKSVLNILWKDWSWSWNSNILATWCEELTHWKRPWYWKRLNSGEGDDRGWDGWMASPTQWTWVWASSRNWWWTGKPGMLQSMGSQSWTQLSDWKTTSTGICIIRKNMFVSITLKIPQGENKIAEE